MPDKSAPRVFVSYSHDSDEHRERVLHLIQALRRNGIDAWADFFVESTPPANWPAWMQNQAEEADYVLAVVTETYGRRFSQREDPGVGAGVRWEGTLITADIYYSTSEQLKYIPVIFSPEEFEYIPTPLKMTNRYVVSPEDDSSLIALLRHLLQAPEFIPARIGESPPLISREVGSPTFLGIDSRITEAIQLSDSDPNGALDALAELLNYLRGPQRAFAYCAMGEIHQRMGFWAPALTVYQRALESTPDKQTAEIAARNMRLALDAMEWHFREGGPVDTANKFVRAVKKGKFNRAWGLLTPKLRLALTQAWIWANIEHEALLPFDREELAKALSAIKSEHPLAKAFNATQLGEFQSSFPSIDETWGAASNPRPIGIDYELVVLSPTGGEVVVLDGTTGPVQTAPFLMKQVMGQWKVENFYPAYPIPGWPPSREEIPSEVSNLTIVETPGYGEAQDD
ncbi:TIR domain-containing protein [Streptomyces bauhiniae]